MFDAHSSPSDLPIARFLRSRQLVSTGLLRRLDEVHAISRERLKAYVLQQLAPAGSGHGVVSAMRLSWTLPGCVSLRKRIRQAALTRRMFLRMCRFFLPL